MHRVVICGLLLSLILAQLSWADIPFIEVKGPAETKYEVEDNDYGGKDYKESSHKTESGSKDGFKYTKEEFSEKRLRTIVGLKNKAPNQM